MKRRPRKPKLPLKPPKLKPPRLRLKKRLPPKNEDDDEFTLVNGK